MSCSYPMWRIDWKKHLLGDKSPRRRHRLASLFERRVHNGGVILQRPEFEMIQKEYPYLSAQIQQVPCGKCIQCRLSRSRDWANRCMLELKTQQNAFFFTLTYDTSHLTFAHHVDPETGETSVRPSLVVKDLQNFFKRFRKACADFPGWKNKQRYFACGEFGSQNARPHYHAIIYNVPPLLLVGDPEYPSKDPKYPLWYAEQITKIWQNGHVVYGNVTWETCAYVARYILDKQLGKNRAAQIKAQALHFPTEPWQDEFVLMSRRPGIGKDYYDQNKMEIYRADQLIVSIRDKPQPVRPCRYYDRLYDLEQPEQMAAIKKRRSDQSSRAMKITLQETSLTEPEYLELKERSKKAAVERLPRPDI